MARNILTNPDFEDGTGDSFTGWVNGTIEGSASITAETTDVFSGSRCVRFNVDGSSHIGIQQENILTVGQVYKYSFWAKKLGSGTSNLYLYEPTNNGSVYGQISNPFILTEQWT
jgi:hypothetical protein